MKVGKSVVIIGLLIVVALIVLGALAGFEVVGAVSTPTPTAWSSPGLAVATSTPTPTPGWWMKPPAWITPTSTEAP